MLKECRFSTHISCTMSYTEFLCTTVQIGNNRRLWDLFAQLLLFFSSFLFHFFFLRSSYILSRVPWFTKQFIIAYMIIYCTENLLSPLIFGVILLLQDLILLGVVGKEQTSKRDFLLTFLRDKAIILIVQTENNLSSHELRIWRWFVHLVPSCNNARLFSIQCLMQCVIQADFK